ncbi:MAG: tetratricopeptide repeat protein [Muribaculaceae bacterium]|nr:tetratricopeptide repeat protein [Muribaculaceae bacterium]
MKRTAISTAIILSLAVAARAQLSMPQQGAPQEEATEAPAPEAPEAPAVQSKYNTPSQSYKDERNAIRRGNALFGDEKYHEALEQYEKAIAVNGGSIRARYNKAVALLQLQSDDNKGTQNDPRTAAGRLFEEIVADAKTYDKEIAEKALYNLGNMAFNDEQYDRSIELYKSALRLEPDNLATRENLRLAQLKKQEQENQEQNQDQQQQDQQQQQQEQQQQQQQDQEQQQQEQQQQQQQQQPMTQSAQQILQSMQNKENQTRKKVKEQEPPAGRPQTDKPW